MNYWPCHELRRHLTAPPATCRDGSTQNYSMEIWTNPACSKCQTATAKLDAAGIAYTTRRYLDDPPSVAELHQVLERLGLEPWDIVRADEARDLGLNQLNRDAGSRDAWLEQMAAHPEVIQRPIITASDSTTVIARDEPTLARVIAIDE